MPLMPSVFLGHGSPMYAIAPNAYTHQWTKLGQTMPTPMAIVIISAHWYTRGVWITSMEHPPTIHDFSGFSQELFDIQYPAPGSPALANRVKELIAPLVPEPILEKSEWGLDHGAWSVLKYLYPSAFIPCIQLSIDATKSPQEHFALAKLLTPLRQEGILILASGNVVHNLKTLKWQTHQPPASWAEEFNVFFKERLLSKDYASLIDWQNFGEPARLSIPTPEHYLPAIYTIGASHEQEQASIITNGIEMSSISMLGFGFGI